MPMTVEMNSEGQEGSAAAQLASPLSAVPKLLPAVNRTRVLAHLVVQLAEALKDQEKDPNGNA